MGQSADSEEGKRGGGEEGKRGRGIRSVGTCFSGPSPGVARICVWATSFALFSRPCATALCLCLWLWLTHSRSPGQALGFWLMVTVPPCSIDDLVVVSRDGGPSTSTLRNLELDGTGGLGRNMGEVKQWATAGQDGHAAKAAVDAPTARWTGEAWAPRVPGREMEASSCSPPIENLPCGRIADRPRRVVIPRPILVRSKPSRSDRRQAVPCGLSTGGRWGDDLGPDDVSSRWAVREGFPQLVDKFAGIGF
jgi:hypothetical protein